MKQVETFLAEKKLAEAELAFKVLVQMDPNLPRRAALEQQIARLRLGS